MDIHKIDWSQIPWTPVRPGVDRKGFSGNAATVALHRLMPGHEPKPHSHPHEQIAYIVSGTIRFFIGGEEHVIGPGGLVLIPSGVEHWARSSGRAGDQSRRVHAQPAGIQLRPSSAWL